MQSNNKLPVIWFPIVAGEFHEFFSSTKIQSQSRFNHENFRFFRISKFGQPDYLAQILLLTKLREFLGTSHLYLTNFFEKMPKCVIFWGDVIVTLTELEWHVLLSKWRKIQNFEMKGEKHRSSCTSVYDNDRYNVTSVL